MHARLGFCTLLVALSLSLSAVARAEESAQPPNADAGPVRKHGPSHQDLGLQGGPGWSSDRTLGGSLSGSLMAEYRWRYLAAGPSFTAMSSVDREGSRAYSGGLSVSAVWQTDMGLRTTLSGILGFDRYEDVRASDSDCGPTTGASRCPFGASETLPHAELRLRLAYVFPVQDRTHLVLGAGFLVGRDLAGAEARYERLDGTRGSLDLGATRVGVFTSAGLSFDVAPADHGARARAQAQVPKARRALGGALPSPPRAPRRPAV